MVGKLLRALENFPSIKSPYRFSIETIARDSGAGAYSKSGLMRFSLNQSIVT